jgi:hypothetical protein
MELSGSLIHGTLSSVRLGFHVAAGTGGTVIRRDDRHRAEFLEALETRLHPSTSKHHHVIVQAPHHQKTVRRSANPQVQTIARQVLTRDANMGGAVDFFDITQLLSSKYNTGQQASYADGDVDYSGKVDFFDVVLLLNANYGTGKIYGPAAGA